MVLKLEIASDPLRFQIQQVLFTTVAAVGGDSPQLVSKRSLMFFQYREQRVVVRPVITHITMDYQFAFASIFVLSIKSSLSVTSPSFSIRRRN